jgi:Holliday junction DNA helicase RuvA
MIAGIEGKLESVSADAVIVKVGGISLSLFVPTSTLSRLGAVGGKVSLHTYLHVREDILALFGFATESELELFKKLITVTGCGVKTALALISSSSVDRIIAAIAQGDSKYLTLAPGIGKKTAEHIIVELRGKLEKEARNLPVTAGSDAAGVINALTNLGYSLREANAALEGLGDVSKLTLEDKIKKALQKLATV